MSSSGTSGAEASQTEVDLARIAPSQEAAGLHSAALSQTSLIALVFQATHLRDAVFIIDLPQVPVFPSRRLPELECGNKGILVWQALRKHVSITETGKRF